MTTDLVSHALPLEAKGGGGFKSKYSAGGLSAPGVTGTLADGEVITVSWDGANGFGAGAVSVPFFNDCSAGTNGASVVSTDPVVGAWDASKIGGSKGTAVYTNSYAHSKGLSLKQYDGDIGLGDYLGVEFTAAQRVAISYFIMTPTRLPGHTAGTYDGTGSPCKYGWLGSDVSAFSTADKPDICTPTNNTSDKWSLDGNTTSLGDYNPYTAIGTVHEFGEWVWVCSLVDFSGGTGVLRARHHCATKGYNAFDKTGISSPWGTTSPQEFAYYYFFGYVNGFNYSGCQIYIDDHYIETGAGAGSYVIIGDASTLDACSNISVCRSTGTRSNTELEVVLNQGPHSSLDGKYIFVMSTSLGLVPYSGAEGRFIS